LQLHEVLDMYLGNSEKNLHSVFQTARHHRPALLFIDELDAIGQRRSRALSSTMRTSVSQLLTELDGVASDNEGVYVIAATNHPWDVDPAVRRPGRFDRMLLVPPPDTDAREAIFRTHLRDRPVERIDTAKLARRTDGFSGADIALVCTTAAELALRDSIRSGDVRMITMADMERALAGTRPSTGAWFDIARNVIAFSNQGGDYDDLRAYMKSNRLL
ncbi:MAG: ATP-binding protein, partial [Ilumatobacter sp.]|nr:ATP-binding protein [Ilumatobacter sp.]